MYPRFECFVESPDSISSQEENALIVLQHAKEDRHYCISTMILTTSFGKKDVRFVKKHDTIPATGQVKVPRKLFLDLKRGAA